MLLLAADRNPDGQGQCSKVHLESNCLWLFRYRGDIAASLVCTALGRL